MREADLAEVLNDYEKAGFRVRYTFDNEFDYVPGTDEPGKASREEAEHVAAQVRRVSKFRGWTDVVVVGQDLEPVSETSEETGGTPDSTVKPQGPQPFVPTSQAEILAQLGALLYEMAARQAAPVALAPQPPARPQAAETDWDRQQRERNAHLPPAVHRYMASVSDKIDPSILVNPEALMEGLRDTDD